MTGDCHLCNNLEFVRVVAACSSTRRVAAYRCTRQSQPAKKGPRPPSPRTTALAASMQGFSSPRPPRPRPRLRLPPPLVRLHPVRCPMQPSHAVATTCSGTHSTSLPERTMHASLEAEHMDRRCGGHANTWASRPRWQGSAPSPVAESRIWQSLPPRSWGLHHSHRPPGPTCAAGGGTHTPLHHVSPPSALLPYPLSLPTSQL